jgi:hypothetical protein
LGLVFFKAFCFFSNLFKPLNTTNFSKIFKQTLKLLKLHTTHLNTMQTKDDAQALIASKIIPMIFKYFIA